MIAHIARSGDDEITIVMRCSLEETAEVARRLDDMRIAPIPPPRDPYAGMLVARFITRAALARIREKSKCWRS